MGKNTPLYHSENYRSKNKNANFLKLPYTEYYTNSSYGWR